MYQIYKTKLDREAYFDSWDAKQFRNLTEELKTRIYDKYILKCDVLSRDSFACQNIECLKNNTQLTLHHIKWQKNGGKDSARNGVTLCDTCHQAYHKAKRAITFPNSSHLPPHIRGHVFKLDKPDREINWKIVKKDMRIFRRSLKDHHGMKLSFEQLNMLLYWLESFYKHN